MLLKYKAFAQTRPWTRKDKSVTNPHSSHEKGKIGGHIHTRRKSQLRKSVRATVMAYEAVSDPDHGCNGRAGIQTLLDTTRAPPRVFADFPLDENAAGCASIAERQASRPFGKMRISLRQFVVIFAMMTVGVHPRASRQHPIRK